MLTMNINVPTAIVLAILIVLVCLSIRLLVRKGTCGHKDQCGGCSESCSGGCPSCLAADSMLDDVRERLACLR